MCLYKKQAGASKRADLMAEKGGGGLRNVGGPQMLEKAEGRQLPVLIADSQILEIWVFPSLQVCGNLSQQL